MTVQFSDVKYPLYRELFVEMLQFYPELHPHPVHLIQRYMPKTTMRAQPYMRQLFLGRRAYKIEMSNAPQFDSYTRFEDLPEDVLRGWFAHELGHLMDYHGRSWLNMVFFGLRYYFSRSFRRQTEHEADRQAILHGLGHYLITTKRFILDKSALSEKYKARIRRYYMSEEAVQLLLDKRLEEEPELDEVDILGKSELEGKIKGERS